MRDNKALEKMILGDLAGEGRGDERK